MQVPRSFMSAALHNLYEKVLIAIIGKDRASQHVPEADNEQVIVWYYRHDDRVTLYRDFWKCREDTEHIVQELRENGIIQCSIIDIGQTTRRFGEVKTWTDGINKCRYSSNLNLHRAEKL